MPNNSPMNTETALTIPVYDGLEIESQTSLATAFSPFFATAERWRQQALTIKVTDPTQKREMKLARESRLALKEIRVNVEKKRKTLKADILLKGKAIDGCANIFNAAVEPIELYLLEQETFAERIEKARIEAEQSALRQSRTAELLALGYAHAGDDLGAMPSLLYDNVLADAKAIKAELDQQIAAAEEREKERHRLVVENARLKAEAEAAARAATEERKRVEAEARAVAAERDRVAEIERQKAAAEAKAQADAAARVLAEERAVAAEAKAKADAVAKLAAAAIESQLRAERRAREVAEAEIQAAKKSEADRLALEAEATRLAALTPEHEKLRAFAAAMRALPVPDVAEAESIRYQVEDVAKYVEGLIQ